MESTCRSAPADSLQRSERSNPEDTDIKFFNYFYKYPAYENMRVLSFKFHVKSIFLQHFSLFMIKIIFFWDVEVKRKRQFLGVLPFQRRNCERCYLNLTMPSSGCSLSLIIGLLLVAKC